MLGQKMPIATVAVKDLKAAVRFYGETLGLRREAGEPGETVTFIAGGAPLLVYRSTFAGSNQATSVTWDLGADLVSTVRDLDARGVRFEHYDMPGMTREGHIHAADGMKVAWFKDPDGNIHALTGR